MKKTPVYFLYNSSVLIFFDVFGEKNVDFDIILRIFKEFF